MDNPLRSQLIDQKTLMEQILEQLLDFTLHIFIFIYTHIYIYLLYINTLPTACTSQRFGIHDFHTLNIHRKNQ